MKKLATLSQKLPFSRRPRRLMLVVFFNGAVIMTIELVGSRIVAPFFGSSLYVWTAIIGTIMAALSVGYWYGGKLADKSPREDVLAKILTIGAAVLLITRLFQDFVLSILQVLQPGELIGSFLAGMILFVPTTLILGMVSPFVARLVMDDTRKHSGEDVGLIFAAGTIGSIAGTFLTGYVLFQYLGNTRILLLCIVMLILASLLLRASGLRLIQFAILLTAAGLYLAPQVINTKLQGQVLDRDSAYNRIIVQDVQATNGDRLRFLKTDALGLQSGISLDKEEPPFSYVRAFRDIASQVPDTPILLIGGGAFTLPRAVSAMGQSDREIDIVEIDPVLEQVSREYFDYTPTPSHRIITEDGRTFLNRSAKRYGLLYVDAYSSLSPPFQLGTTEAIERMKKSLSDEGLLVMNLISRTDTNETFLGAQMATVRNHFPYTQAWSYSESVGSSERQNVLLIAGSRPLPDLDLPMLGEEIRLTLDEAPLLTDDFAPVERLMQR